MADSARTTRRVQFGAFEIDLHTGELWKAGRKRKLTGQPFAVLVILLERPGRLVVREELQKRLWPNTFVDAEHNLNTAINKIREALGDSPDRPRFIETLPRRGYRFIAPVVIVEYSEDQTAPRSASETQVADTGPTDVFAGMVEDFSVAASGSNAPEAHWRPFRWWWPLFDALLSILPVPCVQHFRLRRLRASRG